MAAAGKAYLCDMCAPSLTPRSARLSVGRSQQIERQGRPCPQFNSVRLPVGRSVGHSFARASFPKWQPQHNALYVVVSEGRRPRAGRQTERRRGQMATYLAPVSCLPLLRQRRRQRFSRPPQAHLPNDTTLSLTREDYTHSARPQRHHG